MVAELIALSPELKLLAACDLADADGFERHIGEAVTAGIDWQRFIAIARGNGMLGQVASRLSGKLPEHVTAGWSDTLSAVPRGNALSQLTQTAVSVRLTRLLGEAGIRAIVLKGMALNHTLYAANPNWRSSSDIDILIPSDAALQADELLRSHGFTRQWPSGAIPQRGQDMFFLLANVLEYICPQTGQLIELHHRITLNPSWMPSGFDALYAGSAEIDTGQGIIRGIDGPDLLAYLSWHAFSHMGFRLKWFCDIVRARRRVGAATCSEMCHPQSGYAPHPIALIDALLETLLPAVEGKQAIVRPGPWHHHVKRIVADMEDPTDIPTARTFSQLAGEIGFRSFLMRLSPGWRGKGYELLRALSDPRDVSALGLSKRFAPLYMIAGPFLALGRLARRQKAHGAPH